MKDPRETQELLRRWREAVPDDRLAHLVKDATRALLRALHRRLVEHGVSSSHWPFLRVLWEEDGLTQRELSSRAGVMEPTTYSALNTMERLGYVRRRAEGQNVNVFLTARGRALKRRLVPLAEEVNHVAIEGVSVADVARTRSTLLAIIANLAHDEARAIAADRRVPATRALRGILAHRARKPVLNANRRRRTA